ncbi:winged helix-turn-helix transcriptional regulator [Profundibacter sp.]
MLQITAMTKEQVETCSIRNVLANVNGKWQPLILLALEDGPLRFSAIKRAIGDITQRVQTQNLRALERDGYLTRTVDPGPPVAVTYALTPLGLSLVGVVKPMVEWAARHQGEIGQARARYDARH